MKKLILIILPALFLFLTACSVETDQYIRSDGSVVLVTQINIYDQIKSALENDPSEVYESEGMTLEEYALKHAVETSKTICEDNFEDEINNRDPKKLLSICEASEDGKVIMYDVLVPGTMEVNKSGDLSEYYLSEIISFLDGEINEDGPSEGIVFTLFFEGDVVYSDVGTISGNKLEFNIIELSKAIKKNKDALIRAKVNNEEERAEKYVVTYSIDMERSLSGDLVEIISQSYNNQELTPYLKPIEQIWGLNKDELSKIICSRHLSEENYPNIYFSQLNEINCDEAGNIKITTLKEGYDNVGSFTQQGDYYLYNLVSIISSDHIDHSEESFKTTILSRFPTKAEFKLIFQGKIKEASAGTISDNKLTLTWDDLQKINTSSSVKVSVDETNNDETNNIEMQIITNKKMYSNLKGKIILKVEDKGEAYYIHPKNNKMYFLGRPEDAFLVMREQGIGITNDNLSKIPVALNNISGLDSDSDKLPDALEVALGTNPNNTDSDGDGYSDYEEILNNYSPLGKDKLAIDLDFSRLQAGNIFLQIERNGEAWYINPNNNKRYFLGRPGDAFSVMRQSGLGISNSNFDSLKQ